MSIIRPSGHVIDTDTLYEFSWSSHGIIIAHSVLKDNTPDPLFFSLGLQIEKIRPGKNSLNRVGNILNTMNANSIASPCHL